MNRRKVLQGMGAAAALPFGMASMLHAAGSGAAGSGTAGSGGAGTDAPGPVYELRTYTAFPGKHAALLERFKTYEVAIFARLGMPGVGFWVPNEEPAKSNKLVYMLKHPSREAAKENWARFSKDPEWVKVKAESEKDGVLVDVHEIAFLDLLAFPLKAGIGG
jgi:hypothetical protein